MLPSSIVVTSFIMHRPSPITKVNCSHFRLPYIHRNFAPVAMSASSPLEKLSPKVAALKLKLEAFVKDHCHPAEDEYEKHLEHRIGKDRWTMDAVPPVIDRLKAEAKRQGLWNVFLPHRLPEFLPKDLSPSQYLSNREYGILCEIMGRSFLCPEACNCSAPDTGNMEVLLKHGTLSQQKLYLRPLLEGKIRSAFLMTEPDVASSDATNIETQLTKKIVHVNGKKVTKYILNGNKWWSTGAMDPRCKVALVLAKMDYSHVSDVKSDGDTGAHGVHTGKNILFPNFLIDDFSKIDWSSCA